MKVSVVIPVYNRAALVGEALGSLLRQRADVDLDIVVVDDGSTDGSADVVAAVAGGAPEVRCVRQPNGGVATARNTALAHLHPASDLVTFLDSDDVCVNGRFSAEVPLFAQDAQLDLTYGLMTLTDAIDGQTLDLPATATCCTVRGISLTAAMFRRGFLEALGGMNPALRHSEDLDFLLRAFEVKPRYRLVDHVAFLYRRHPGNATRDRAAARHGFLNAMLMAAQRRRRDPDLGTMPKFIDVTALQDNAFVGLR